MQRINALKRQGSQQPQKHPAQPPQKPLQSPQPHPEYHEPSLHKVIVTPSAGSDGTNIMQIRSNVSSKIYTIHLEFAGDPTGMGEEIRAALKEKYVHQQWEAGSLQIRPDALQSPSQEGERKGQGI